MMNPAESFIHHSSFIVHHLEIDMPVLLLNEDDVRQVLTMEMALEAVEQGLRKLALDEAMNVPRTRVQTDHVVMHTMAASAKTLGAVGYKSYTTARKGNHFYVGL